MLDLMRKHAGTWMIKVILGLIIIVFTFWGVGSYSLRKGNRVAVVNGTTITLDQYREAYNGVLEQLRRQFGNNLDDDMIEMFNVKKQALDSVIDQALLIDEAERLHLRVTDDELVRAIQQTAAFQGGRPFRSPTISPPAVGQPFLSRVVRGHAAAIHDYRQIAKSGPRGNQGVRSRSQGAL